MRVRTNASRTASSARTCRRSLETLVGLHAAPARRVHRRVVGIGDDDGMPESLEMPRHPLTFRGRFEQNARARPTAEHRGESLVTCHDAAWMQSWLSRLCRSSPIVSIGWPPRCVPRRKTMSTFSLCGVNLATTSRWRSSRFIPTSWGVGQRTNCYERCPEWTLVVTTHAVPSVSAAAKRTRRRRRVVSARSLESGRDQPDCKGDRGRKSITAV